MGWPGPLTHRQALAWAAWREADMDRPSRADFYRAQIAYMVGLVMESFGGGRRSRVGDYLLRFARPPAETPEEKLAREKAEWAAIFGRPKRR